MQRRTVFLAIGLLLVLFAAEGHPTEAQGSSVSFAKDVMPILQKNCQACHRAGEIAPMSFETYENTRPYARAIKAAIQSRKMPPWFADPQHGRFANDRSLTAAEIETLSRWADDGAPLGDPRDAPAPIRWPEGWQIAPDHVVTAPAQTIPAEGTIEWGYLLVPSGFTKDTWVSSIEVRPSSRAAVHHVVVMVRPHSSDVPANVVLWEQKQRDAKGTAPGQAFSSASRASRILGASGESVNRSAVDGPVAGVYVPGVPPQDYRTHGAAILVRANSDLVLQVHYQTIGKPVSEVTRVGFTIAKEAPARQFVTIVRQPASISDPKIFRIPAGDPNWPSPPLEAVFNADAELVWMMPHMHARGKDMTYRLTYPDGRTETILHVPRYDFNWQLGYDVAEPIKVPKGTRLRVDAHFDNSAAKRGNPDPTVDVYAGTQTWEEMMNPWFGVIVDSRLDVRTLVTTTAVQGGA